MRSPRVIEFECDILDESHTHFHTHTAPASEHGPCKVIFILENTVRVFVCERESFAKHKRQHIWNAKDLVRHSGTFF